MLKMVRDDSVDHACGPITSDVYSLGISSKIRIFMGKKLK